MQARFVLGAMVVSSALGLASGARAQAPSAAPPSSPPDESTDPGAETPAQPDPVERARALFAEGIDHVRNSEWGEALADFQASSALRAHAVTTYNMGASYRAMGRYTRAREKFLEALQRHAETKELPPHLLEETRRFLSEIDAVLGRLPLRLSPPAAEVTVDGAPLRVDRTGTEARWIAGVRSAGEGEPIPSGQGTLLLDPGTHVVLVSAEGYQDRVINRLVSPGRNPAVTLELQPKPSQLRIRANTTPAQVFLNGRFLGMAPLEVLRPAGTYELKVVADDREPFSSMVQLESGKDHLVRADLMEESPSVLESWWFWTAAGVVVTGAVIGTYFATRPEPTRPPLDGGGLGWVVPLE